MDWKSYSGTFDFTSRPTSFHDNGDGYGYYNTEPFRTVEEAETFKENMKPYGRLFPLFNTKFAYDFLELDNHLVATRTGYKIASNSIINIMNYFLFFSSKCS